MLELMIPICLIALGYAAGSHFERKHYNSIREREAATTSLPVLTGDLLDPSREVAEIRLVSGSTAIALDYFKVIAGTLKNFFGGRITAYETLIDRARRESTLRMKSDAAGFDVVINARLETSSIGKETGGKNRRYSVECYAYGTAIRYVR